MANAIKISEVDIKILNYLIEHRETSFREIAKDLNISAQTVYNRLNYLKKNKIIEGIITKINAEKIGYLIRSIILFKINIKEKEKFIEYLKSNHNIVRIFEISGQYNIALDGFFKSTEELYKLIKKLSEMKEIEELENYVIYKEYKEYDAPFPLSIATS